ncbi:MAG: MraY family glycosyltransferase [Candidatus Moranbacteria bacterium]|nr:MraY family glycosyltransferase [Candidatus Moranbacteria bacterium]
MNISLYLSPFITSFLASVVLIAATIWLCGKFNGLISKRKSSRHVSGKRISRLGGVAIILSFSLAIFLDPNLFISQSLWGILIACGLILVVGLWDDFRELDWKTQLFFQVAVAVFVFIMGVRVEYITNPFGGVLFLNLGKYLLPSLFFVIGWLVLLMNSANWLDGVDGLSGGISLIGSLTIFFLSLKPEVNQPPVGIIAAALAGALAGFLLFNFHPAKILAGTAGSMFMGFILAVLAVFAGTKIATALLIMTIPIIDALWVIGERLRAGTSIFRPDQRHLHFKLVELGWSQRKITLFFYGVISAIALVALNTRAIGKMITIILVLLITVAVLIFVNRKLKAAKTA